jgi:hypothetical protein
MYKQIFIVETKAQINYIRKANFDKDTLYVAMTPVLYKSLNESGYTVLTYRDILPFDYEIKLSKYRYKILDNIGIKLNNIELFETISAKHSYKFFINFLVNYIVMLLMIIEHIKDKYPNSTIITNEYSSQSNSSFFTYSNIGISTFIENEEHFCSSILDNSSIKRETNIDIKSRKSESRIINYINKLIAKKFVNKRTIVTPTMDRKIPDYLNYIINKNTKYIYIRMSNKESIKEILYSLKNYLYTLLKKKFLINGFEYDSIISISGKFDTTKIDNLINKFYNDNAKFLIYNDINFYEAIKDKIDNIIIYCTYLDSIYKESYNIVKYLNKSILLSHASNNFQEVIAESYNNFDNESYNIAHCTLLYPSLSEDLYKEHVEFDVSYFIDETPYKNLVIQSPLTMNSISNVYSKSIIKSKPIMWGSCFDNFNKKIEKEVTTILFADSSNIRGSIRPLHFMDIFDYLQVINDLAKSVNSIDNCRLLIKIRESEDLSNEVIEELIKDYDNCELIIDKSLTYCLEESDIIVGLSSTTIEEALLVDIPVLLYDIRGYNKHIDQAQDITSKNSKICEYLLYLNNPTLLTDTLKSMISTDYTKIKNRYTYSDIKIFNIDG